MSVSRGCLLVERKPGEWFCIVARDEYDYDFESYDVFGPARTEDAAWDAMNGPNPGGSERMKHDRVTPEVLAMITKGLEARRERERVFRRHSWR